jgi:hypothetical protein
MMRHGLITGGIPTKRVTVFGITTETDEEVMDFATAAAGETYSVIGGELHGSLFGRSISRHNDYALVTLHTD